MKTPSLWKLVGSGKPDIITSFHTVLILHKHHLNNILFRFKRCQHKIYVIRLSSFHYNFGPEELALRSEILVNKCKLHPFAAVPVLQ